MTESIQKSLHQVQKVRAAAIPENYLKQKLTQIAAVRSLAGDALGYIGECEEALLKLVDLLYEKDTDGAFANVDNQTGKILRPLPWGQSGYKQWRLRDLSASVLRAWLMQRSVEPETPCKPRPPLFIYDQSSRRWYLNIRDYSKKELAQRFLDKEKITLQDWRTLAGIKQAQNRVYLQKSKERRKNK